MLPFLQMHADHVSGCGTELVPRKKKKIPSFILSIEILLNVLTGIQTPMLLLHHQKWWQQLQFQVIYRLIL